MIGLPKVFQCKEVAMKSIGMEAEQVSSWPLRDRINALKRIVSKASVEEVLEECGRAKRFCKCLPDWFMVWFVIALGLFCTDSYRQVFRWLNRFRKDEMPGRSTLCEARKRLGAAPFLRLLHKVVRLLARSETVGAFYRGMRLMAIDGFVVDIADTPANERAFGRPGSGRAAGAFPQAHVLALCEAATHVLWRCLIKPLSCGEVTMAHYLLRFLEKGMLLLWDRNFLSYRLLKTVVDKRAHLLARIKKNLIFKPIRKLEDGSYLAYMYASAKDRRHHRGGILVRIIEYTFDDPNRPGSGERHRLLTTLLDATLDPARELILLYHERWEEELTIDELKTHQRERPVLRSQTPAGVVQEICGLLLAHYIIRALMHEAAKRMKIDPRRVSFTDTLKTLRCRLPEVRRGRRAIRRWYQDLIDEVTEQVIEPRRNRVNPRVIKRKMSNWPKKRPEHRNYPQPTKEIRESILVLN
jgi:hypothetical protein